MKTKIISILLFIIFNASCTSEKTSSIEKTNYEDSVLQSIQFIDHYEKLPLPCSEILIGKIFNLYSSSEKDSISDIYSIKAAFYPDHYSKSESDMIEKFSFFIYRSDTVENLFFGVRKRTPDIIFLNKLEINETKKVLTKEEHVAFSANLIELEKLGCVDLNMEEGLTDLTETFRSVQTFEHNENYLWVVDSIQSIDGTRSLFSDIDTFNIIYNKRIVSKNKEFSFFFDNYELYLVDSKDTITARFISYAEDYRILIEDHDGLFPWVYLKRLR